MAFTARTETYVDLASLLSSPYDITVTKPPDTADGDILFCWIGWYNTSGYGIDSVPAGWTLLGDYTANIDKYALYYKIASSEGASWDWSFTGNTKVRAVCSCYTSGDFDPADPIDVVSNTAYRTSDVNCIAASMSVSAVNSPLIFWAGAYGPPMTFTKPSVPTSDWIEDDDAGDGAPDLWTEVCSMIWSGSGATGAMSATISAGRETKHAFAVALNPTAGAFELSRTDGLIVGASRSQSMTAGLSRTDGLTSGDTSNPLGMLSKLDGLKAGDSLSILAHLLASDGLKMGDTPLYNVLWSLIVADGIKLGDSSIRNLILPLLVTDGTKLGDSLSILARLIISDGLELGDSPSREMIADLLRSDGMKLGDLCTFGEAILYLAIVDGVNVGDTSLIEMLADIQASDGLKVGDTIIQSLLASLGIEDGLKLGDTILAEVDIGGILLSIIEGIKMGDSNSLDNLIELAILEAIKVGDTGVLGGVLGRVLRLLILTTQKRKVHVVTGQNRKVRIITGE